MFDANILSTISLVALIISCICFVLSIFFWFKYNIPSVIGDLSGSTARKSIAKMREMNERTGNKSYRPSEVNKRRAKLTETMHPTTNGLAKKESEISVDEVPNTEILSENKAEFHESNETELLDGMEETMALIDDGATEELITKVPQTNYQMNTNLEMLDEIIFVHTNEEIEL